MKNLPEELPTSTASTASDLYTQLAFRSASSVHRLRITKGSDGTLIPNSAELSVEQTGLRDQSILYVKDLGMSILKHSSSSHSRYHPAQPLRPSDSVAYSIPRRIPWSRHHPPAFLFSPSRRPTIHSANSYLLPDYAPFRQTRARNSVSAPIFGSNNASAEHL